MALQAWSEEDGLVAPAGRPAPVQSWSEEDGFVVDLVGEADLGEDDRLMGFQAKDLVDSIQDARESTEWFRRVLHLLQYSHECPSHERQAIQAEWHRRFDDQNIAQPNSLRLSVSDVGFLAICMGLHTEQPREVDHTSIGVVWMQLVVLSCQHTKLTRTFWPDAESWSNLKHTLASVVALYFEGDAKKRAELTLQLEQPDAPQLLAPELMFYYESLREPVELTRARAEQKAKEALKRAAQNLDPDEDDNPEEGMSDEARGALWRSQPEEILDQFVSISARVFHSIERDNAFVARWGPPLDAFLISASATHQVQQWLMQRMRTQLDDTAADRFRNMAADWMCPLGSETHRFRSKETHNDISDPVTVLGEELGVDLGEFLYEQTTVKPATIAAGDTDTSTWEALFVSMLDMTFRRDYALEWRRLYVLVAPHSAFARRRLESEHMHSDEKRPVIVRAQRKWWLFQHQRLRRCSSLLEAVIAWCHLIAMDYNGRLEGECDIRHLLRALLAPAAVVREPSDRR